MDQCPQLKSCNKPYSCQCICWFNYKYIVKLLVMTSPNMIYLFMKCSFFMLNSVTETKGELYNPHELSFFQKIDEASEICGQALAVQG